MIDWQYLYQEIGTWRDGELQTIGVNHRYSVLGSIRRQQWDLFNRTPDGMQAWRVQAKTLADFQTEHPGFVRHWSPASFGENWLPDYAAAPPERRADLDLPAASMPPGLGTPLLLAFYWVRWAGDQEREVPVFLPGFKHNSRADIRVVLAGVEAGGLLHLHSSVRHPQLSETQASAGDAWISPDHHLVRETFEARSDSGSAHGELHLDGCQGEPPRHRRLGCRRSSSSRENELPRRGFLGDVGHHLDQRRRVRRQRFGQSAAQPAGVGDPP